MNTPTILGPKPEFAEAKAKAVEYLNQYLDHYMNPKVLPEGVQVIVLHQGQIQVYQDLKGVDLDGNVTTRMILTNFYLQPTEPFEVH